MKGTCIALLLSLFLLSACGGAKGVDGNSMKTLSAEKVIDYHDAAMPDFETLAARMQVVYADDDSQQSITVSLRMEKDKTIWIKASILGITMAKALITPTSVQYYESVGGTYFNGDFALLSEWLNTDITFEKAQAILLGQSLFALDGKTYKSEVVQMKHQLQPKQQPMDFIHSLLLYPNFKIAAESLSQPSQNRLLTLRYDEYQQLEGGFYPTSVHLQTAEGDDKTTIDLTYKKIDVNASVGFPFNIPNGYDEIRLK
ncbi:DUF4292 domain-containing protein [Luteirhabdus pelagi]|uniref:DUF4292 domain-containing protein n=1 Tax=Luteirhabdus pelagi TaxID=2792783 RepID=UPI00193A6B2F|nr:DUF4292 domain-containing protein [Luteirhabdus pelagi]